MTDGDEPSREQLLDDDRQRKKLQASRLASVCLHWGANVTSKVAVEERGSDAKASAEFRKKNPRVRDASLNSENNERRHAERSKPCMNRTCL